MHQKTFDRLWAKHHEAVVRSNEQLLMTAWARKLLMRMDLND
jgi:hypothetical protein